MIFKKFAAKFPCTPRVLTCQAVTWPVIETIIHTNALVYTVAISPDGSRIVSNSNDYTIQVWDAATGKPLGTPLLGHTCYVLSVAILLDGSRIVSSSLDKTIRVWDAGTGKPLGGPLLGHTDHVWSVAISPDGRRIVSGSDDKTIRVWDAETGEPLGAPLQEHTDNVNSVAISPDGSRIVSGSDDKTIRVWDTETGKPLGAPLLGHTALIRSVAISPDGSRIVSGSDDTTIRVWDVSAFLDPFQTFVTPAICFSSNPTHALRDTPGTFHSSVRTRGKVRSRLVEILTRGPEGWMVGPTGWMVGPRGCLLLWVPPYFPHVHAPSSILTIPDALQLDLSCFAHGTSWYKCREQKVPSSS